MPENVPAPNPNDTPEPATDPAPNPNAPAEPDEPEYPEGLGDAGKRALDAERQARRDAEAKLKELEPLAAKARELEDANKTEHQRLTEALEAAKADSTSSKAEVARLKAAIKHGLSEDDLELLGTGTPEEIEQRAEKLAQRLAGAGGNQPVVPSSRNQGANGADPKANPDQWLRDAARR